MILGFSKALQTVLGVAPIVVCPVRDRPERGSGGIGAGGAKKGHLGHESAVGSAVDSDPTRVDEGQGLQKVCTGQLILQVLASQLARHAGPEVPPVTGAPSVVH